MKVGGVVSGEVSAVTDFGVFVRVARSSLSGLCHKSELRDKYIKDPRTTVKVGAKVQALIIKIDAEKKRLSLSMKESKMPEGVEAFAGSDSEDDDDSDGSSSSSSKSSNGENGSGSDMDSDDDSGDEGGSLEVGESGSDESQDEVKQFGKKTAGGVGAEAQAAAAKGLMAGMDEEEEEENSEDSEDSDSEQGEGDAMQVEEESDEEGSDEEGSDEEGSDEEDEPELDVSGSANGDGTGESDSESEEEEAAEEETKESKKKRKKGSDRAAERVLEMQEQALMKNGAPESVREFERLVVSSPNSSFIWIKYIAYFVAQAEIAKARRVAERALKSISFREEGEKMNVWTARLNLENSYGTDESLERVVKEAVQYCDELKVRRVLARIFVDTKKPDKAEEAFKTLCKKFGRDQPTVWTDRARFLFRANRGGGSQ